MKKFWKFSIFWAKWSKREKQITFKSNFYDVNHQFLITNNGDIHRILTHRIQCGIMNNFQSMSAQFFKSHFNVYLRLPRSHQKIFGSGNLRKTSCTFPKQCKHCRSSEVLVLLFWVFVKGKTSKEKRRKLERERLFMNQ